MTDIASDALTVQQLRALAGSSVAAILSMQDDSGAYPASPTFSAYRGYSWFRDGAFIADAVSHSGAADSAGRFHDWCSGILTARSAQIERIVAAAASGDPVADSGMLPTRFTMGGDDGGDDWWDFQLDGYGTWLWAVIAHADRHGVPLAAWQPAVELAVDYLVSSWARPCFDWWEEHADEVHVSTLGCIAAGLLAAAPHLDPIRAIDARAAVNDIFLRIENEGLVDGGLAKWLGGSDVDASVLALIHPLGLFPADSPIGAATIAAIDNRLNVGGGVHRYSGDTFFGGGQWPLLSCMLGLAFNAAGDPARASDLLQWAASTVDTDGHLPEQVGRHLLAPAYEEQWIERWGTAANPLLWSHATYLKLSIELGIGAGA